MFEALKPILEQISAWKKGRCGLILRICEKSLRLGGKMWTDFVEAMKKLTFEALKPVLEQISA